MVVPLVQPMQLVAQLIVLRTRAVQLAAAVALLVVSVQLVAQRLGATLPLCSFL